MNDVLDSLLSPPRAKIKKDQDVNSSKFESLRELLKWFQRRITSDVYVLKVCRDEIWRCGMGFPKNAIKNTNILVKDFEVLFLLLVSKVWGYKDKSCYLHHLFPVKVEWKILENISIFHFLYFYGGKKRSEKSDESSAIWEIFSPVKSIPIYKFTRTFFSVKYSAKFLTCTSMIVHTGIVCDHLLIDYESENSRFQEIPNEE